MGPSGAHPDVPLRGTKTVASCADGWRLSEHPHTHHHDPQQCRQEDQVGEWGQEQHRHNDSSPVKPAREHVGAEPDDVAAEHDDSRGQGRFGHP